MTNITVIQDGEGNPVGFRAQGHSLTAPSGEDVVCASITVLFEYLSSLVEDLPSHAVEFHQKSDDPRWEIVVDYSKLSDRDQYLVQQAFSEAASTFGSIHREYPGACTLAEEPI